MVQLCSLTNDNKNCSLNSLGAYYILHAKDTKISQIYLQIGIAASNAMNILDLFLLNVDYQQVRILKAQKQTSELNTMPRSRMTASMESR